MLVAPLVSLPKVPDRQVRARAPHRASGQRFSRVRAPATLKPRAALVIWLVCGILALLCIPAARGSAVLGATLPFWLVGAPLLNLAWLERASLLRLPSRWLQDFRAGRSRRSTRRIRVGDTTRRRVHQGV
jgi:hypothetical protein